MDENKTNIPQAEVSDETLNEVSGGVQAGQIVSSSYIDEFGNKYVRDENGNFVLAKDLYQQPKKKTYL